MSNHLTKHVRIWDAFKFVTVCVHVFTYLDEVDSAAGIHFSTAGGLRTDAEPEHGAAEAAEAPGESRRG